MAADELPPPNPRRNWFAVWRWRLPWLTWLLILMLMPIAYVLSIPPLYWLLNHGYLPFESYGLLLELEKPLVIVRDKVPPLWEPLGWYYELWDTPSYPYFTPEMSGPGK